jgi:hypothetical protein
MKIERKKITMLILTDALKRLGEVENTLRHKGYKAHSVSPGKIVETLILKTDMEDALRCLEESIAP